MLLYKYLFFFIYRLVKSIELDLPSVKYDDRAFETVCFMTMFEMFNLVTFIYPIDRTMLWIAIGVMFLVNCLIFLSKKRFRKIIQQFETTKPSIFLKFAIVGYLISSILLFVFVRRL